MAGGRPFDDARYPDLEGFGDCFLCGRKVDPLERDRGWYDEPPAGPELPIHLKCAEPLVNQGEIGKAKLSIAYHEAIRTMARHCTPEAVH